VKPLILNNLQKGEGAALKFSEPAEFPHLAALETANFIFVGNLQCASRSEDSASRRQPRRQSGGQSGGKDAILSGLQVVRRAVEVDDLRFGIE
jgi:hypothetical protein